MKRLFTFTALTAMLIFSADYAMGQSQGDVQIGLNLRAGAPAGDFADYAGFGIGGGANINYLLSDNASVGLEVGYMAFLENELSDQVTGSAVLVPIVANIRYMFGDSDFRPMVGLGLGYTIVNQTVELSGLEGDVNEFDETYSGFTIAPHLGFTYGLADNVSLYFVADYSYILNEAEVDVVQEGDPVTGGPQVVALDPYSYIGLNLGVTFTVGN